MGNSSSPNFESDYKNFLNRIWAWIKKKYPRLSIFIIILFIISAILWKSSWIWLPAITQKLSSPGDSLPHQFQPDVFSQKKLTSNNYTDNQTNELITVEKQEPEGLVMGASNIAEFNNWESFEKFDSDPDDSQMLCPTFSAQFPEGRIMYSPFYLDSNFKVTLSITPLSMNRGNIVLEYKNFFRCIIGNGNYKNIDCQKFPYKLNLIEQKQQQEHSWINKYSGIKPQTNLFLTATATPMAESEIINLKLDIRFIPADDDSGQYKTAYFEYNIPVGKPANSIESKLGIGFIDPGKYKPYQPDQVCAKLHSLEIEREHKNN